MAPKDIRDRIFVKVRGKRYCPRIASRGDGILSGTQWLERACKQLGITVKRCKKAGTRIKQGEMTALLKGDAKQIALAEEELIGCSSFRYENGCCEECLKSKKDGTRTFREDRNLDQTDPNA